MYFVDGMGVIKNGKTTSVLFARPETDRDQCVIASCIATSLLYFFWKLAKFLLLQFLNPIQRNHLHTCVYHCDNRCTKIHSETSKWHAVHLLEMKGEFFVSNECWALLGRQPLGRVVEMLSKYVSLNWEDGVIAVELWWALTARLANYVVKTMFFVTELLSRRVAALLALKNEELFVSRIKWAVHICTAYADKNVESKKSGLSCPAQFGRINYFEVMSSWVYCSTAKVGGKKNPKYVLPCG